MKKLLVFLCALALAGPTSLRANATLIDMDDETIYDTDMQLTWLRNAGMGGFRGWYDALAWADNLTFAGFDDWRLPISDISGDCGDRNTNTYDCTGSEMGHLYYTELGNAGAYGGPNEPLNTGPFTNLQPTAFWSGTGAQAGSGRAWAFNFSGGAQGAGMVIDNFAVWAVRPGERSVSTPDASVMLLLGPALIGLLGFRRKLKG